MTKQVSGLAYVTTFLALVVLATVSLLVSFVYNGVAVALVVAMVKALLVLFVFMHLIEQRFSNRLTILVGFGFAALLIVLTAADVGSRQTSGVRPLPPVAERFYVR